MGFQLSGIFLRDSEVSIESIKADWPGCRVRRFGHPFAGIGVAFPSADDVEGDVSPTDDSAADDVQQRVVEWSRLHPAQPVAFVATNCFGGTCLYEGFTCLDGHVLDVVPLTRRGEGGLRRLLLPLGIALGPDEEFPPLRRGYFGS